MIKYFHELTEKEFNALQQTNMTWAQCAIKYPQPPWCGYPDAIHGKMGCWGLVWFDNGKCKVIGEEFCKNCDLYKASKEK